MKPIHERIAQTICLPHAVLAVFLPLHIVLIVLAKKLDHQLVCQSTSQTAF